ncbi:SH3 domain-containing protein [Aureibacter tunicatorum]|uniref:Energy-converting hydrogenase Eha subunit C n=1 Tax=Aureibacter tunicatorum TaxID=866807 RepID=A0AAE4BUI3_9BACT|nr:SH3 domain-containing protein [Aureibacter tunicatorum]MDR6240793.1 energy-converting hydrogenase Eha subunit C [Aureibacter tunicatorum]BDD06874.1 hypothetical protein AUTU_43570 [Aureibacter tunicatorum]
MFKKFTFILAASVVIFNSCTDNKSSKESTTDTSNIKEASTETAKVEEVKAEEFPTICVWDKTSLLATPDSKGKWLSSISLGESLIYLGEKENDKNSKRVYCKVRLSDGKEGWANEYCLVVNGSAAAILKQSPIHKRPDALTLTDKKFEIGEMLAIEESKGDWIKVVGKERKKSGWLNTSAVTTKVEDVTTAILMLKKIGNINEDLDIAKAKEFIQNAPYSDSYFIKLLEERVNEQEQAFADETLVEEENTAVDEIENVL